MQKSVKDRLAALEVERLAQTPPLERAYELVALGVDAEQWPGAELDAYCDERPELEVLTDEELEQLCAEPWTDTARGIMARLDAVRSLLAATPAEWSHEDLERMVRADDPRAVFSALLQERYEALTGHVWQEAADV